MKHETEPVTRSKGLFLAPGTRVKGFPPMSYPESEGILSPTPGKPALKFASRSFLPGRGPISFVRSIEAGLASRRGSEPAKAHAQSMTTQAKSRRLILILL